MNVRQMLKLAKEENLQLVDYMASWMAGRNKEEQDQPDLVTQLLARRRFIRSHTLGFLTCWVLVIVFSLAVPKFESDSSMIPFIVLGVVCSASSSLGFVGHALSNWPKLSDEVKSFLEAVTLLEGRPIPESGGPSAPTSLCSLGEWPNPSRVESAAKLLLIEKAREKKALEQGLKIPWKKKEVERLLEKKGQEFGRTLQLLRRLLPGIPTDAGFYYNQP